MNEWLAFGIVAFICGVLASLTRWAMAADEDCQPPDTSTAL
jgi:hypothetical protein